MDNKTLLNKIIEGTQHTETVTITYNGEDYNFTLKPLTSGELSKVQRIERKGLNININNNGKSKPVPLNAGELANNTAEAMYTSISYSLDAPTDKIRLLPQNLVEDLFKEVMRISNLTEKDLVLVRNFQ